MKHPALTRVFAIVLLIMCLILLTNGALGFVKAEDERREGEAYCERLAARIESYREMDEKLNDSISYEDAYAELEKLQEEYDDESSQHRTDLAMYSATKGGYLNGAKTIYEAQEQIKGAKAALKEGKEQFAAKEAEFNAAMAAYNAAAPGLAMVKSAAEAGVTQCTSDAGTVGAALAAFKSGLKTPVNAPEGAAPQRPNPLAADATEEEQAAFAAANKACEDYAAAETAYNEFQRWLTSDYPTLLGNAGAAYGAGLTALGSDAATLSALASQLPAELLTAGGSGGTAGSISPFPSTTDYPQSADEASAALGSVVSSISGVGAGMGAIAYGIDAYGYQIAAGQEAIGKAKVELYNGEKELVAAETALQYNLEMIWLELSELEEDQAKLADEKSTLDKASVNVGKKLTKADELKALEDKHKSTRILLTNVDEIGDMVDAGGDIVESSEKYLAQRRADTERIFNGKMVICALAVISGVMGALGLPAAFEKLKKRAFLILPVVFCLVCAAAADGINMYLGLGQMYAALFTVVFALVQLLIILPRKKPRQG